MPARLVRTLAAAASAAALAVLAACGGGGGEAPTGDSGPISLTLQQYPGALLYISDIVAEKEGIFERNGLKVEFVNPGDGATSMRLIASGDTQGVLGDVASGLSAAAKQQPIGATGSVINKSLFQISARSDLLATPGDWKAKLQALRGKKVGVPGIGGSADLTMRGMLEAAGLTPDKDVTIISITTIQAAIAQFQQKGLDAYIYIAPAANLMEKAGVGGMYIDIANEAPPQFANAVIGLITNKPYAEKNPEAVRRWIKAEEEAIAWLKDPANRQAAVEYVAESITAKDTALAEKLVDYMNNTAYSATKPGLQVPIDALNNQIDLLTKGGVIPAGSVKADSFLLTSSGGN